MIAEAEAEGSISDASEVRIVTRETRTWSRTPSQDLSLCDDCHVIVPACDAVPPRDRRYGDGALLLAHEQVMRDTPKDILKQLDWR